MSRILISVLPVVGGQEGGDQGSEGRFSEARRCAPRLEFPI